MKSDILALGLGLGAILLATQALHAEGATCLNRAEMLARLAAQYGETRQAIGLAGPTQMVEIFASAETGTWTITVTTASGQTCLLAAGESFEPAMLPLPAPGDPA